MTQILCKLQIIEQMLFFLFLSNNDKFCVMVQTKIMVTEFFYGTHFCDSSSSSGDTSERYVGRITVIYSPTRQDFAMQALKCITPILRVYVS